MPPACLPAQRPPSNQRSLRGAAARRFCQSPHPPLPRFRASAILRFPEQTEISSIVPSLALASVTPLVILRGRFRLPCRVYLRQAADSPPTLCRSVRLTGEREM